MKQCPSCGGILGRDCFNSEECAEITRQMQIQAALEAATPPLIEQMQRERERAERLHAALKALHSDVLALVEMIDECEYLNIETDATRLLLADAYRAIETPKSDVLCINPTRPKRSWGILHVPFWQTRPKQTIINEMRER